ncbi:MAG: hypothetical protein BA865_08855 [Desulfobacterales bacterium S5133MH4]|nr:MAG: hypothetical protein BA865_08855 [Desulfobacterales bacterium S5133MH4]
MKIALDTNIICKACGYNWDYIGVLSRIRDDADHGILHDTDRKLLNEYRNNAGGYEFFRNWYQEMERKENGIHYLFVDLDRNDRKISKKLTDMGFTGEVDRILVALALETRNDRYIITEDSDFGKGDTEKAKEHKDVLDYLTNRLQLTVHGANEALSSL